MLAESPFFSHLYINMKSEMVKAYLDNIEEVTGERKGNLKMKAETCCKVKWNEKEKMDIKPRGKREYRSVDIMKVSVERAGKSYWWRAKAFPGG